MAALGFRMLKAHFLMLPGRRRFLQGFVHIATDSGSTVASKTAPRYSCLNPDCRRNRNGRFNRSNRHTGIEPPPCVYLSREDKACQSRIEMQDPNCGLALGRRFVAFFPYPDSGLMNASVTP